VDIRIRVKLYVNEQIVDTGVLRTFLVGLFGRIEHSTLKSWHYWTDHQRRTIWSSWR